MTSPASPDDGSGAAGGVMSHAAVAGAHTVAAPDAIILCGGRATRLAGTGDTPKALRVVAGRPFIEWQLDDLAAAGVRHVVLATGAGAAEFEPLLGDGDRFGIRLSYSAESVPLGTAGAARLALDRAGTPTVLVLNGDTFLRFDPAGLGALLAGHKGTEAALQVVQVPDRRRFGAVVVGPGGAVVALSEKDQHGPGLISGGVYLLNRSVLEALPPAIPLDFERDVLPRLVPGRLRALVTPGPFIDIGTPESLAAAEPLLRRELRAPSRVATAHVRTRVERTIGAMRDLPLCMPAIVSAATLVADAFLSGGKVLLCGNGGSAADAQHVAAELISMMDRNITRPALPALALTTDTSILTAYANDVDFDGVFARQVEGLGAPGDVLIGISTSGRSRNVIAAMEMARRRGMRVVGLFGRGGPSAPLCDVAVQIPATDTQTVQECLLPVEHWLCELVEIYLHGDDPA